MPPTSSSRYQSKVFNFFNQQSQRLSQKLENTLRSVQVATKFRLEALLLPLYQALQTDKFAGKKLQTPTRNKQHQLKSSTPLTADTPIYNILELVKNLPSAAVAESQTLQNVKPLGFLGKAWGKFTSRLGFSPSPTSQVKPEDTLQNHIPKVQGIAVNIENRNLVLVSKNNKILDVLTIKQQAILTENINSEIAKYSQSDDLKISLDEQEILPKIDSLLNKLTNTDKNIITDISRSVNRRKIKLSLSYPGKILALLDQALAKLESNAIIPVKQRSQEIIEVAKNQLEIFVYGKEQGEITVNSHGLKKPDVKISELIESAINYFFGGRKIPKIAETETFYELPKDNVNKFVDDSQIQSSDAVADSWLTWSDLYGEIEIISPQKPQTETKVSNPENRSYVYSSQSKTEKPQHRLKPDWIETTATFLGYEKHLLEHILEWLDHIMVWIEMILMNIIYFLKGLLQVR
ncbi:hypothetical protein WJM97_00450 [Okeanomitos corallinicola TIOX110]|uniref:Flagellar hook-length control protein FliK n=1 Tax=Okeanomitos corallinicola TIOX110 TaxID=3133117 RepID=A0ABZ2UXU9_9CYAN